MTTSKHDLKRRSTGFRLGSRIVPGRVSEEFIERLHRFGGSVPSAITRTNDKPRRSYRVKELFVVFVMLMLSCVFGLFIEFYATSFTTITTLLMSMVFIGLCVLFVKISQLFVKISQ